MTRPNVTEASDEAADFLIEVDEDLTELVALPLDTAPEFAAIDELDSFTAGEQDQPEPTKLILSDELHDQRGDHALAADIQRAKEAGVSLASARIQELPAHMHATLTISNGVTVDVTQSVLIIGRGKEVADVVLQSEKVSRQHAAIIFARGEFFIEDLGSTNGTLIYGKRVKRVRLTSGMNIRIGGFDLTLTFGD